MTKQTATPQASHTPGPWHTTGGIIRSQDNRAVARAGCLADLDESDANARLIAAAPELLKAMRHLIEMIEECHDHDIVPCDDEWPVKEARAAIARATGNPVP